MDGDGTSHSTNRARSRAEEVLEQILASKDGRSFIKMSQNTYSETANPSYGRRLCPRAARREAAPASERLFIYLGIVRCSRVCAVGMAVVLVCNAGPSSRKTARSLQIPSFLPRCRSYGTWRRRICVRASSSVVKPALLQSSRTACLLRAFYPYSLPCQPYKDLGNRELRGYFTWRASLASRHSRRCAGNLRHHPCI